MVGPDRERYNWNCGSAPEIFRLFFERKFWGLLFLRSIAEMVEERLSKMKEGF